MTRPMCLSLCLAVAILAGVATSQENLEGRLEVNLYILDLDFTQQPDLRNMSSSTYMDLKNAIMEAFSPIGGRLDQLIFSDGGGCVKAYISWQDHNLNTELGVMDTIKTNGLTVAGKTWMVSFNGCKAKICPEVPEGTFGTCVEECNTERPCADGLMCCSNGCGHTCVAGTTPTPQSELLSITLYLPTISYDVDLTDKTSALYQQMSSVVIGYLSRIGGELEGLIFSDGGGCVKVYITWRNGDQSAFMQIIETIRSEGLRILSTTWPVSFDGCAADSNKTCPEVPRGQSGACMEMCGVEQPCPEGLLCCSNGCGHTCIRGDGSPPGGNLLTIKFYVVGLTWMDSMRNHRSPEYMQIKQVVEATFSDLGGNLRTLELARNNNCVGFYVEWNAEATTTILDLMTRLRASGVQVMGQTYQIRTEPCQPDDGGNLLTLKFYVVGLTWMDSMRNHGSPEYMQIKQIVEPIFSDLGGNLRTLELAKNYNCVEFYVEWNAETTESILNVMGTLKSNGVEVLGQSYQIRTKPCLPADTDICPEVPSGTGGICVELCGEEQPCPAGQKCCSNGCGHSCVRVGYAVKVWSIVLLDIAGLDLTGLDLNSPQILGVASEPAKALIQRNFAAGLVVDVEVTRLEPYTQEGRVLGAAHIIMYLSTDSPNDQLEDGKERLLRDTYDISGVTVAPKAMYLGISNLRDIANPQPLCMRDMPCLGICKELMSGRRYCSCDMGYMGMDCSVFDCRKGFNQSIVIEDSHCMNGARCELDREDQKYHCMCQSGYIGHLCEMRACDLFDRPCGTYGTCDFNIERGQVCRCNDYRGGLQCENSISTQNEDITDCERDRRMAMFVHEQLKAGGTPKGLTISMKEFLSYIGDGTYIMPMCWPRDDAHNGEYHSMCIYDSKTGRKVGRCVCHNGNKQPNGWHYVGDGDCREYIRPLRIVREMLYLMDTPWTEDLMDTESELYMSLERQIKEAMSLDQGYLSNLRFSNSQGCVQVTIEWQVQDYRMARETTMKLIEKGIMVDGVKKILSHEMCQPVSPLCSVMNKGACGEGRCLGDLENYRLCSCPSNRGGLFCQMAAPEKKMSLCERHRDVTQYAVDVITGKVADNKMNISMAEFLSMIVPPGEPLGVPKCWPNDMSHYGAYHSFCNYDISTGEKGSCYCVNDKGDPNFYHYDEETEFCTVTSRGCESFPCGAFGRCQEMRGGGYLCSCHEGYIGKNCETLIPGRCPIGRPLMTEGGTYTCRTKPCPVGFECHAERGDRWTNCCLDPDFLCEQNPCQAGGVCKFDLLAPKGICQCGPERQGLLCENEYDGSSEFTECDLQQQFYSKVIEHLRNGRPLFNTSLNQLRTILEYAGIKYIPSNLCTESGQYKTAVDAVFVRNPDAESVTICMDRNGNYEENCAAATCDILSSGGREAFCQNGGRCVGKYNGQLCDCKGTGFHGVRCEIGGESVSETMCTQWRDTSQLVMRILSGSVNNPSGGPLSANALMRILHVHNTDRFFVPVCDKYGRYMKKGCWHMIDDVSLKLCHCANDYGERFGKEENPLQPPDKCGGEQECPEAWGKNCMRPEWWCSEEVQCNRASEKCSLIDGCDEANCHQCVPKRQLLPCDARPCEHDRFHLCDPCSGHGTCANSANGRGHTCYCYTGWRGLRCEINTEICSVIPKSICGLGCVGDINSGELCKCPPGFGGISCTKPVRTRCEKQKALYDQAIGILSGKMTVPGDSSSEVKTLIGLILEISKVDMIPTLECNADGMYNKVQCAVHVRDMDKKDCYCTDDKGNYLNSNTEKYIGFDVCTAPNDPSEFVAGCYSENDGMPLEICLNGGNCTLTLYDGKICDCPTGYSGLFCEREGPAAAEPISLCELYTTAWLYAHLMHTQNTIPEPFTEVHQKVLYSILKRTPDGRSAPKAECEKDGEFKAAVCYHNLMTREKGRCYCWGFDGISDREADSADDSEKCFDMSCAEREACPNLECEHGYKVDQKRCQICACNNPCETTMCGKGERCVLAKTRCKVDYGTDHDEQYEEYMGYLGCTKAVCRPVQRSGSCPGDEAILHSSIIGGVVQSTARNQSNCEAQCYDDADCGGNQKCCGFCGRRCVDAESLYSCRDAYRNARAHLDNIKKAQEKAREDNLSVENGRLVERLLRTRSIWLPKCNDTDEYFFKSLQCEYKIDEAESPGATPLFCFCVDRLGERIPGAVADPNLADPCDVKPYSCPFVEPKLDDVVAMAKCEEDLDCRGGDKCCGSGRSKVCTAPFNKQKLSTLVDMLMMNMCEKNADMCQGNSQCVSKWEKDGEVCQCPSGRTGPFCEDTGNAQQTVCEKKESARIKFAQQFNNPDANSMGITKLVRQYYTEKREAEGLAFDIEKSPVTMVWYRCMNDGKFEPMQCIVDMKNSPDGSRPTHCFCVDENGMEIGGTRMLATGGQRPFCGGSMRTCPRGYPYRGPNGQKAECDDSSDCPMGYACQRSAYGELICCATSKVLDDVCMMPMDVGTQCEGAKNQSLYYYDSKEKVCREFSFMGCEGNPNRFSSMDECNAQCVEKTKPERPMCQIPMRDEEFCGRIERYFFNTTSKMCEKFIFNGCYPGPDSFDSLEHCCGACNKQGRCKMGKCPKIRLGVVGTCVTECSSDAECPGKRICCSNGCANVCMIPDVDEESDCLSELREVRQRVALIRSECEDVYFPRCERDGTYSRQQCKVTQGICWCVTPQGNLINGTMTRGLARCETVTETMMMMADKYTMDVASVSFSVCSDNKEFYCCAEQLCDRKCAAYPNAVCRINPCGGCKAEFYYDGAMVDCDKDLSKCATELKTVAIAMTEHRINADKAKGRMMNNNYDTDDYREVLNAKLANRPRRIRNDIPGRCQQPPETGLCKGFLRQWYFDPVNGVCDMFIWGMCGGNDNRFSSPEECYAACHPTSSPCHNKTCGGATPVCRIEYRKDCYMNGGYCELAPVCTESPATPMLRDYFVPRCAASGEYTSKQCHSDFCGCVNEEGEFFNGLVKGQPDESPECTPTGFSSAASVVFKCPNNQSPQPECLRACNDKKCLGNPMATCVVDLCSSDCKTKFVDAAGAEVQCSAEVKPEDRCEIFTFDEEELDQCEAKKPCGGNSVKSCDPSVCLGASERCKNPCAVCVVDPCSCEPYFIHASTEERLSPKECQYLSYGNCEVKRCSIMSEIVKANLNKIELASEEAALPECDEAGSYKPKQCMGSKCMCVDEFGSATNATAEGNSCKEVEKIKRVKAILTFNIDYDDLEERGLLKRFKQEVLDKLVELGIDPVIITMGEPYKGSTKVPVTFDEMPYATTKDMAVIANVMDQMKNSDVKIKIENEEASLVGVDSERQTASQIEEEKKEKVTDDDDDGLSTTEKIIIGVVVGVVGLVIIGIIAYCVCCRRRSKEGSIDNEYEHERESKTYDSPAHYNQAYDVEDDDRFVKVRL